MQLLIILSSRRMTEIMEVSGISWMMLIRRFPIDLLSPCANSNAPSNAGSSNGNDYWFWVILVLAGEIPAIFQIAKMIISTFNLTEKKKKK